MPGHTENIATELIDKIAQLSPFDQIVAHWRTRFLQQARPKQVIPLEGGSWTHAFLCSGRGFGKTWTGSNWIGMAAALNPHTHCGVICPTNNDTRRTAFEGLSGLLAMIPEELIADYNKSMMEIHLKNGSKITGYSAEKPDRLRGPNHGFIWFDELAAFQGQTLSGSSNNMRDTYDMAMMTLRAGDHPRCIITSTPRPLPLIREIIAAPTTMVIRGSTIENSENLAPTFLNQLTKKYEGTRLGRQELDAEILEDMPGALWTQQMIEDAATSLRPTEFHRIVVGVDPSGSEEESGSSQGIVTAGLGNDGKFYILEDASCKASPKQWAQIVIQQYQKWQADLIVAEQNYGGAMVQAVIETAMPNAPVKLVTASRGKQVRAEPIAALYEQGRVKHLCRSPELEQQMVLMTHIGYEGDEASPDRLDALVWAMTELSTAGDQAEGVILKRSLWQPYSSDMALPEFKKILLSFHLPFDGTESFDQCACTVWGVFRTKVIDEISREFQHNHMMMLYAWSGNYTLAEFSKQAQATVKAYRDKSERGIDIIIENAASNSLFKRELRKAHVKVRTWSPKQSTNSNNRYQERAIAAALTLEQGAVWYHEHEEARSIVNDCALFPNGARSEIAKSVIQALLYLRQHLGIEVTSDELDREEQEKHDLRKIKNEWRDRNRKYYG